MAFAFSILWTLAFFISSTTATSLVPPQAGDFPTADYLLLDWRDVDVPPRHLLFPRQRGVNIRRPLREPSWAPWSFCLARGRQCPRSSLTCSLAASVLCLSKEILSSKPGPVDLLLSLPLGPQTRHKKSLKRDKILFLCHPVSVYSILLQKWNCSLIHDVDWQTHRGFSGALRWKFCNKASEDLNED